MTLLGVQVPRLQLVPEGDTERGDLAVEFARWCGLTLYPWQEDLLRDMCRTDEKGRWAAREVLTVVARQNGKGEVLVARELAGIYLFGEKTILHTAHFMDTAVDALERLWGVIESHDGLMHWWEDSPGVSGTPESRTGNGKEKIIFPNGAKILFRTRTAKTGRGLSVDLLILDECFDLPNEIFAALGKLIRARESAQMVFISSPVNREKHLHGAVFSAKRWAAIDGAKRTLFKEWSPSEDDDPFVFETWAKSNPSLVDEGPGAQLDDIELDAQSAKTSETLRRIFLVETLAAGDWYPRDGDRSDFVPLIAPELWRKLGTFREVRVGEVALGVEVSPDSQKIAFVACGQIVDGFHVQAHESGTKFVVEKAARFIAKFVEMYDPVAVVIDRDSTASVLIPALLKLGIDPMLLNGGGVSLAFRETMQAAADETLSHDNAGVWQQQLSVAERRTTRDGKFPSIDRFSGDVSELVAATFAVLGLSKYLAEVGAVSKPVEVKKANPKGTFPRFKKKGGELVA